MNENNDIVAEVSKIQEREENVNLFYNTEQDQQKSPAAKWIRTMLSMFFLLSFLSAIHLMRFNQNMI